MGGERSEMRTFEGDFVEGDVLVWAAGRAVQRYEVVESESEAESTDVEAVILAAVV